MSKVYRFADLPPDDEQFEKWKTAALVEGKTLTKFVRLAVEDRITGQSEGTASKKKTPP
jgi:hypothetical protein